MSSSTATPQDRLAELLKRSRERVRSGHAQSSIDELKERARAQRRRSLSSALRRAGRLNVLAEIKRASPSRGEIRPHADAFALAAELAQAGAAALSVLTEPSGFCGSLEDLKAARMACDLPLLRKDFIIDPWQVAETAAAGADALLLIVAALTEELLRELLHAADEWELEALVEVHDRRELERALAAGARLVGVNNRDLRSFRVDPRACVALAPELPEQVVKVAESGLSSRAELERLHKLGYDAFLIGESLMRAPEPGAKLRELVGEP